MIHEGQVIKLLVNWLWKIEGGREKITKPKDVCCQLKCL